MKNIYIKLITVSVAAISLFVVFNHVSLDQGIQSSPLNELSPELVNGVDYMEDGEFERAITNLRSYPTDGPLADYTSLLIARCQYQLDRYQDSLSTLTGIDPDGRTGVLSVEKSTLMAKAYLGRGRLTEATEAASSAWKNALTPDEKSAIREVQLNIAEERGDFSLGFARGVQLARQLNLRYIGRERDRLFAKLSELSEKMDPTNPEYPELLYDYSRILTAYSHPEEARSILIRYLDAWPEELEDEVYLDIGYLSGFNLYKPMEALVTFNRLLRGDPSPYLRSRVLYYRALINNRLNDNFDLTETLIEIGRDYPETYFGKLSINSAVNRLIEGASITRSEEILEKYKYLLTDSSVRDITWKLFYRSMDDEQFGVADSYLKTLESYYGPREPVIEYYRFKLDQEWDRRSPNYIKLINSIKDNPYNYYSLLAIDRRWTRNTFKFSDVISNREFSIVEFENSLIEDNLSPETRELLKTAIMLKSHGLAGPALARLERLEDDLDRKDYLTLKTFWEESAGRYRDSIRSGTDLLYNHYDRINRPPLEIVVQAYPMYYQNEVEKYSAEFGIFPALLFGLVRQESAFERKAYSVSGARGITQVMPRTAGGIASDLGMEDFEVNDLFNVDTGLRMGSFYISKQLKRNSDIRLALTAYHGGPGNLGDWQEAYGSSDVDLFHERIPKSSTHNYVKAVYRNYSVYEKLSNISN